MHRPFFIVVWLASIVLAAIAFPQRHETALGEIGFGAVLKPAAHIHNRRLVTTSDVTAPAPSPAVVNTKAPADGEDFIMLVMWGGILAGLPFCIVCGLAKLPATYL